MSRRTRLALLIAIFAMLVVGVGGIVVTRLYHVGFEQQSRRVAEIAGSRAAILSAVARFDAVESADFPGGASAATMEQLRRSHADFPGFGDTGEYLFARQEGGDIVFQVPLRHAPDGSLDTLPLDGPDAEPMRRALAGETGTMVGRDYRGEQVLAAYRPVPELELGLVAKIDLAEVRAPYVRASLLAGGVGLVLLLIAVALVGRIGGDLITRLEESEASIKDRQRELEAALERERLAGERLRLALEAADQGVYDYDPRTGRVEVSPEFEEMLGYEPGTLEMTVDHWVDSLHPSDRDEAVARFERYLSGEGDSYESEFRMAGADGEYRWILSLGEIVARDEDGTPLRFTGTHTDITHFKEVEKELADREAHLKDAQSLGRMGSWELIPSERWTWWSEGFYEVIGRDPSDFPPSPEAFMELIHQEDRPLVEAAMERMLRDAEPVEIEFRIVVGDELRQLWGVGRCKAEEDGPADRFIGVVKDVTEERLMEEMLRQSQKMEAVGQLTAGMAHDFNNLLTTILANSDLGLSEMDEEAEGTSHEVRVELKEIHSAARRGRDLVRQLMTFSRDRHLSMEETDMVGLVRDMSALVRRALPESVEVSVEGPETPLVARVDPGVVQQIVLNLVNNAGQAMADGGRFSLVVERVEADADDPELGGGDYVRVRARDTGSGMTPEVMDRAFEPFFTTKAVGEGTGLGLSMVYGLMRRQEGAVRLSSVEGEGTTVTLLFPLVAGSMDGEARRRRSSALQASGSEERLLVVEDEAALRRTARRILVRAGYEVVEAATGVEALEVLGEASGPVDLVVSDIVMPELGGLDLMAECRERGIDVPFLFMSGYSPVDLDDPELSDRPFLAKPWTVDELLQAVRSALDGVPSETL